MTGEKDHETDISPEQHQTEKNPRVSRPHGNSRWPQHSASSSCQGSSPPFSGYRQQITRYLFRPEQRIRKRPEYLRIQSAGQRFYTREAVFVYLPSDKPYSRLGMAVSRKTMRHAVDRNRFKRRLRELFRHRQHDFSHPVDVVVIARRDSLHADFNALDQGFSRFLRHLEWHFRKNEENRPA